MSRQYIIERRDHTEDVWESIEPLLVNFYPWDENGYMPETKVKVFYTPTHIHVRFRAYEQEIEARYEEMNDPVYKDSCVEFFINPLPDRDDRYLNFETNCLGTLNLGIGDNRYGREPIDKRYLPMFEIKSSITLETIEEYDEDFWQLEYAIPLEFINAFYEGVEFKTGTRMKGNFYKCGDETKHPHFGCWNATTTEEADFHRPEFFGELIFE